MWLRLICLFSLSLVHGCTDPNCEYCDYSSGSEQCETCSSPLFPSGSFCEPCSSSILSCQITDSGFWACECPTSGLRTVFETSPGEYSHCSFPEICQICVPGFYYSGLGECLPCDAKCQTCHDASFCTSCPDTLVLVDNNCCEPTCSLCNFESCLVCNEGFELVLGTCLPAAGGLCRAGCSECNDNQQCLSCKSGYYLDEESCLLCDSRERSGCPSILAECSTGCSECKSLDKCLRCVEGYYLYKGYCKQCSPRCKFCTEDGKCLKCSESFRLKSGFCCDSNCESCNDENCWVCTEGLYLSNYKCQTCPDNCLACKRGVCSFKPCTSNCKECDSDGNCLRCNKGLYPSEGQCVPCHYSCDTCDGPNRCLTCPLSRVLIGLHCCERKCNICDYNLCYKCQSPYELSVDNKCALPGCPYNCLACTGGICTSCEPGYFIDYDGTCQICDDNCYTCSSKNTCNSCTGSAHLVQDACCEENCISCNLKECLVCPEGQLLNKGKCYTCPTSCEFCQNGQCVSKNGCDKGCLLCTTDACISCSTGYYFKDKSKCESCPDRCSSCVDSSTCSNCNSPYVLKGYSCCPSTCSGCDSSKCSGCIDGYLLDSKGVCVTCPNTCVSCNGGQCQVPVVCSTNCKICSDSKTCTNCDSGYMVNSNGECSKI